jgi:hypothetical protein
MKFCLMKCPDVITTVKHMNNLRKKLKRSEQRAQTFILLHQVYATKAQDMVAEASVKFDGNWTAARLQSLRDELEKLPKAHAKATSGRQSALTGITWIDVVVKHANKYVQFIDVAKAIAPLLDGALDSLSFVDACDKVADLPLISDYRSPHLVRIIQQLRVEWGHADMPVDGDAWLRLRDMNSESTKMGFGYMQVDSSEDAKDFLIAYKSSLLQHTKNTTHRALINLIGLHDVSVPVCEMMSLLGNQGLGACVLKKGTLQCRRQFLLTSLPAAPKSLSKTRLKLSGWTWSQASIWTGKDTAAAKFIVRHWFNEVRVPEVPKNVWSAMLTAPGRKKLSAQLKAKIRTCSICGLSLHTTQATARTHRACFDKKRKAS